MGLRIHSRRLFGTRLVTLIAAFALVVQPMYGVLAAQAASAVESPLTVGATCVDQKVVLTATFTESTPGWQGGKVWYSSDYGSTPAWSPQNIPAGDVDTWTQSTGQTSIAAGVVTARVSGLVAVEKTGWFGIKYTILEAYNETLAPAQYADINCDSTAPSTSVIAPLDSHYNSPVAVSWSPATDNHSGIGSYEVSYRYANGTDVVSPISVSGTTHTFVGSESTQGAIFVSVVAIDGNGNRSAESAPVQFIYDSKAPIADITSLQDGQYIRGANVPVRVTVDDANLEALSYRITNLQTNKNIINKVTNTTVGLNDSQVFTWNTDQPGSPDYADGKYSVYVSGRDVLQQRGEKRIHVTVDNTKPTLTVRENQTIKASGSYFKTSETVRIQPQDANLGKVFINDSELTQYYGSGSFGINWYLNQHPTTEKFTVVAEDKAGNRSDEYVIMIDRTAPTVSINSGTGVNNGSLGTHPDYRQVSFKLYDKNSNLKEVSLNGNVYNRGGQWNDLNWVNINKSHLNQGQNTIIVRDIEGNSSQLQFNFDTVAPKADRFTYSNDNGKAVTKDDVIVTMTTSEPVQTPAGWSPVDGSSTEFTRTYSSNGKYDVVLTDLAGNVSTSQKFEVKRIDKVAPQFNIENNSIFSTSNVEVQVAEDNLDKILVNGESVSFTSTKPHTFNVMGDGQYVVTATDKAGNPSSVSFTIDTTAPTAIHFAFSNSNSKGNGNVVTKNDVTVTMTTGESVQTPDGWTRVTPTQFTRTYSSNGKYDVVLTDLAGNVSTSQKFEVKRIDKINPAFNITNGEIFTTENVEVVITEENLDYVEVDESRVDYAGNKPYSITVQGNGTYNVTAFDKAGNTSSVSFTINFTAPVDPENPGEPKDSESKPPVDPTTPPAGGAPSPASGGNRDLAEPVITANSTSSGPTTPLGSVFAAAFTTPVVASSSASEAAVLGDQDVLGTTDTAAPSATANDEADDAEESNGLAWYWWLIIAAAGIGAFWWIIAAVRKSNDEE